VQESVLEREVGNVTADAELSFEYQLRPTAERRALGIGELTALPFQVQIKYTRLNGMKCVRIMTQSQEVTANKAEAEAAADMELLSAHVAQQTAAIAADGEYTTSRGNIRAWHNYMNKIVTTTPAAPEVTGHRQQVLDAWGADMLSLETEVNQAQMQEEMDMGHRLSDDEDEDEGGDGISSLPRMPKPRVEQERRTRRSANDSLANHIQKAKKTSHSKYA
jgi:hypothetical protein